MFDDSTYVPKLVQKAPSMRAIKNYNNIMTDLDEPRRFKYNNNNNNQQESMTINGPLNDNDGNSVKSYHRNENGLDNNQFNMPIVGHIYTTDEPYDYPTIKSSSGATFIESENGTERVDELGSTSKLVTSKMQRVSFIFTICLACDTDFARDLRKKKPKIFLRVRSKFAKNYATTYVQKNGNFFINLAKFSTTAVSYWKNLL